MIFFYVQFYAKKIECTDSSCIRNFLVDQSISVLIFLHNNFVKYNGNTPEIHFSTATKKKKHTNE